MKGQLGVMRLVIGYALIGLGYALILLGAISLWILAIDLVDVVLTHADDLDNWIIH